MKKRTVKAPSVSVLTLLTLLAYQPLAAYAGRITMQLTDEQELPNGKRLCVYCNSIYTFTHITRSMSCQYTRTFNTDDAE
ncbi:Uncharacterised protein [Buttiauxella agrestis]|uniref:Uncharacterized protein n=1 Tax=Buttiauxella agrestis TaxID=82977 RepID=A0A381C393_9ENTR|nr:Uncharacterised protein [Buttiauxella agrestis]